MLDLVKIDLRDGLDELTIDLIDKVEVDSAPPLLQAKTTSSSTSTQIITADVGYAGLSSVTINPYILQNKNVSPTTSPQTITADGGYNGLSQVNISAVTNSIDANIQPQNIVDGVTILGVTGTYKRVDVVVQGANVIRNRAFQLSNITGYVNNSATSSEDAYCFSNCDSLEYIRVPNMTNASEGFCNLCDILSEVDFSKVATIGNACFDSCIALQTLRLPVCSALGRWCFSNCKALTDVYLGYNGVCTCRSDMFSTWDGHKVYFHIPSGLKSSYESATNWSTYVNNGIVEFIEDYA